MLRKNGEASAIGCTAEQMSWVNPGSVSCAERAPPLRTSLASSTKTDRPARAHVIAAAKPFGPAPITMASYGLAMLGLPFYPCRSWRRYQGQQAFHATKSLKNNRARLPPIKNQRACYADLNF